MKKKISLVLLTVLMICSCGKQDPIKPVAPNYVDSHAIINNSSTNTLNLTEEQMETIERYVKYASSAVCIAALVYVMPKVYNWILSPAGTLMMKFLHKIPKLGDIGFIKDQADKPFFGQPSLTSPMKVEIVNNPIYTAPPPKPADAE